MANTKVAGKNYFLLLGSELGEKLKAIANIRAGLQKKYAAPGGGGFEETSFYPGDATAAEIAATIQNGALFSQGQLFIVKDADAFKKTDAALLANCVSSLSGDTTVIITSEENKVEKCLEDCAQKENKKIFYEMFEERKLEWLQSFWRQAGYKIEKAAAELLLEMLENNTESLRCESQQLMLFLKKDAAVTADAIGELLSHSKTESAFTLFSALAKADMRRSVEIMHSLLGAKIAPQVIFAGLSWCFKRFRDYYKLTLAGVTDDFELKKNGINFMLKKDCSAMFHNYVRRETLAEIFLQETGKAELLLRSVSNLPEDVILDFYLYSIYKYKKEMP
jgi:DNA polymerase-3 subunit delta